MRIRCPRCRGETHFEDNPFRPFCSERCRLIDLGRWVSEQYQLSAEPEAPSGEGPAANEPDQR